MNVNREFIARWADALESGEYPQTRYALHRLVPGIADPAGYCCVGVACVVAGIEGEPDDDSERFAGENAAAPGVLRDLVGGGVDWKDLYHRNDGSDGYHPHSFAEIAAHLRETYLAGDDQ